MERRFRPRVTVAVRVYVHGPSKQRFSCSARDLSSQGAFLVVRGRRYTRGTPLKLTFVVNRGQVSRMFSRKAVVIRSSEDGVGVLFQGNRRAPRPVSANSPAKR